MPADLDIELEDSRAPMKYDSFSFFLRGCVEITRSEVYTQDHATSLYDHELLKYTVENYAKLIRIYFKQSLIG